MNKNDLIIVLIPVGISIILVLNSLWRKKDWVKPFLLSVSASSISFIFIMCRYNNILSEHAAIGFNIGMISSPIITIPLAITGWKLGRHFSNSKSLIIFFSFILSYALLAMGYLQVIKKNTLDQQVKIELDCKKLPFHCAINKHQLSEIPKLKLQGFNIEARDQRSGNSALWYSLQNSDAVSALLTNGANPDSINYQNETPLSWVLVTSLKPDLEIAKLLLSHGADINKKFGIKKQKTILNVAIIDNDASVVDFALENGANHLLKDDYDKNACDRMKRMDFKASKLLNSKCDKK